MQLDIITPDEHVYSGEVSEVTVPGTMGKFQVLKNHAPIISTLAKGQIKFKNAEGTVTMDSEGGVIEVLKNKVVVLAERITGRSDA
jgi:F-type H+-transporting ATPase subunit epsilon